MKDKKNQNIHFLAKAIQRFQLLKLVGGFSRALRKISRINALIVGQEQITVFLHKVFLSFLLDICHRVIFVILEEVKTKIAFFISNSLMSVVFGHYSLIVFSHQFLTLMFLVSLAFLVGCFVGKHLKN